MRIATLQFAPQVGTIEANFKQANTLLAQYESAGDLKDLDLLALPEMAFSGYNYPSLSDIKPFLEPTAAGVSTQWAIQTAKRLQCVVAVGYPEVATVHDGIDDSTAEKATEASDSKTVAYNSLVFVDRLGDIIAHCRKSFLYYTDDTWAKEGTDGFYEGLVYINSAQEKVKMTAGICMDINPYKFETPWTAYEFATHCKQAQAKLVVVSTAWLTRLTHDETFGNVALEATPDMDTVGYWIERFRPLLSVRGTDEEVLVVFANRTGEEGDAPIIGEVRYAGSSCVMGMQGATDEGETNVRIWNIMGRATNGVMIVDTDQEPMYGVSRRAQTPSLPVEEAINTPALETAVEIRT